MKIQIARLIFLTSLDIMKSILDLISFKMGKTSDEYLYMKKKIMDEFYNKLRKLFKTSETQKIVKQCPDKCSLRKGYSDCPHCNGSGYTNLEKEVK